MWRRGEVLASRRGRGERRSFCVLLRPTENQAAMESATRHSRRPSVGREGGVGARRLARKRPRNPRQVAPGRGHARRNKPGPENSPGGPAAPPDTSAATALGPFTPGKAADSPGGAKDCSPRRKTWEFRGARRKPRRGGRASFAPAGAGELACRSPLSDDRGYILTPLRGWERSAPPRRLSARAFKGHRRRPSVRR